MIAGLAVFSAFLVLLALWFIVFAIATDGASAAVGGFILTLPLMGLAGLAAWSAYRLVSVGAVWSALRVPAVAGATLGSVTLLILGIGAGILTYLSSDEGLLGFIIFVFAIVFFTFPGVVFGTLGLTIALKLARTKEVSVKFGQWMTSAALAGVFFFLGFVTLGADAPRIVPLALWAFMLLAGLQMVGGSRWGTAAVLAVGFVFSWIAGLAVAQAVLVPLALLALTLLWGLHSARRSWSVEQIRDFARRLDGRA